MEAGADQRHVQVGTHRKSPAEEIMPAPALILFEVQTVSPKNGRETWPRVQAESAEAARAHFISKGKIVGKAREVPEVTLLCPGCGATATITQPLPKLFSPCPSCRTPIYYQPEHFEPFEGPYLTGEQMELAWFIE